MRDDIDDNVPDFGITFKVDGIRMHVPWSRIVSVWLRERGTIWKIEILLFRQDSWNFSYCISDSLIKWITLFEILYIGFIEMKICRDMY